MSSSSKIITKLQIPSKLIKKPLILQPKIDKPVVNIEEKAPDLTNKVIKVAILAVMKNNLIKKQRTELIKYIKEQETDFNLYKYSLEKELELKRQELDSDKDHLLKNKNNYYLISSYDDELKNYNENTASDSIIYNFFANKKKRLLTDYIEVKPKLYEKEMKERIESLKKSQRDELENLMKTSIDSLVDKISSIKDDKGDPFFSSVPKRKYLFLELHALLARESDIDTSVDNTFNDLNNKNPDILKSKDSPLQVYKQTVENYKNENILLELREGDFVDKSQPCPKCGAMKLVISQLQTRGGDEGVTTFIKCTACSFSRKES